MLGSLQFKQGGVVLLAAVGGALALGAPAHAATNNIYGVVGTGTMGFAGDAGPAAAAQLKNPASVVLLPGGGYLIADTGNQRVRRVTATGTISTVAGNGTTGSAGDGGAATAAQLSSPNALSIASDGTVLIADSGNNRIRRVTLGGAISTVAGTGVSGFGGDGGAATAAQLTLPSGVAATPDGGFLIGDYGNDRVRRVSPGGTITTVAGSGASGFGGDGGPATAAMIDGPEGLAVTPDGGFLVADYFNSAVRKISPGGSITTVAGIGDAPGSTGDGGPAIAAKLFFPTSVVTAPDGGFVIADQSTIRVRRVSPGGTITTIAGGGPSVAGDGDGGPATAGSLSIPAGMAVTPEGGLLVADTGHHRVRFVDTDLRPGPAGPAGPAGASVVGLPGLAGPIGPAGPSLAVAIAASKFTVKRRASLTISYAATRAAKVTLVVLKGKKQVEKVRVTGTSKPGANRLKLKVKTTGKYSLKLTAIAGGETATDIAKLVVRR